MIEITSDSLIVVSKRAGIKVKIGQILVWFFLSILLIVCLLCDNNGLYSCISTIFISALILIQYRKKKLLFIVLSLILISNYSFIIANYIEGNFEFDYSFDPSGYYRLLAARIVLIYTFSLLVFLNLFCNERPKNLSCKKRKKNSDNPVLVVSLLLSLVVIWIFFYDFSFGSRSVYSPIYEYSVLLFVIAFYFSENNNRIQLPVIILAVFYVAFDFLGGQRSTGLQILIVLFVYLFYKRLRIRSIILLGIIGIILMNYISVFRNADMFSFSPARFLTIAKETFAAAFSADTASYAYYSSVVYLYARGHFSSVQLIIQFLQFIASQLTVGSVGRPITEVALDYHFHFYGGVLPIYLYYYLGYLGVVLIALLSGFLLRFIYRYDPNGSGFNRLLPIYITATSIRWYLYSPYPLLRGVLLLAFVFLVFKFINRQMGGKE